jgi:vacuolar iron transporter family protein
VSVSRAPELTRLRRNWRAEQESAALYTAFAQLESDPQQRRMYQDLACSERRHAAFWEQRLFGAGEKLPVFRTSLRTLLLIQLARILGIAFVIPSVIAREMKDRDDYVGQDDAQAAGLPSEEHRHAAALRRGSDGSIGNNLRAAVLGANDGLASNFCLMMGVAGAGSSAATILVCGIAGLVGGACSMALGEWLSVTNARELALSQLDREIGTFAPDEGHLSVISAGHATSAALFSFVLFALGAVLPVLPFCVLPDSQRVSGSVALSIGGLFALGVATSLFNARSALFSGVRQVAIGVAAAAVTYCVGAVFSTLTRAAG